MSQTARQCPNCGQLNYGKAVFCQSCGEDISEVHAGFIAWAQSHQLPPVATAVRDEGRKFVHFDPEASGSGLVWMGLLVVAAGLLIDLSPQILAVLVTAGAVVMMIGLWQLRIDYGALSRLGVWLVLVSALALAIV